MRVLVTGAAGFLGHHVVEHLLRATEHEVVALVSFRHRGCPLRLVHLAGHERLSLHYHDLRAPVSDRLLSTLGQINVVLNLAAESHVDRSIEHPIEFVRNNVDVASHVMDAARRMHSLRALVQLSTDEVYGPAPEGEAHSEWSAMLPSSPYAASKVCQEAVSIAAWRTYGLPVVIVNVMNLIGERQDREKYVPKLIRGIVRGDEVTVHGALADDSQCRERPVTGSRMYLHARNCADALVFLMGQQPSMYPQADRPDRWNVAGEREVTNLELAEMVAAMLDRPLRYQIVDFHSARPGHDRRYALNSAKIRAAGWQQPMDLEQSLRKTVRWTVEHPEWMA